MLLHPIQVAAEAKISKRPLYTQFPTRVDLFEAVIVTAYETGVTSIEAAERKLGTTPDSIALERLVTAGAVRFPHMVRIMNNPALITPARLLNKYCTAGSRLDKFANSKFALPTSSSLAPSAGWILSCPGRTGTA